MKEVGITRATGKSEKAGRHEMARKSKKTGKRTKTIGGLHKAFGLGAAALLGGIALFGCGAEGETAGKLQEQQAEDGGAGTYNGRQTTEGGEDTLQERQAWGGEPRALEAIHTVEYTKADTLDETLMESVNSFAYHFGQKLGADGGNYFFSPYSISSALAVLDNAAGGGTRVQMERMLGITDTEHYNQQMSFYMQLPQKEEACVQSANSIWIDRRCKLSDAAYTDYLPLVEYYYGAEIWEADFAFDPDGTKDAINRWVDEHTGGMIPHFKDEVDSEIVLSIINAVYFYGEWSSPFKAEATYEQTFHGQTEDAEVLMMHQGELFLPYYEQGGLRGISLPYGDGSVVMNILLPAEGEAQSAAELFESLSDAEKNTCLTTLMNSEPGFVESLALPKFSMECSVPDMPQLLKELGMEDAFVPQMADFSEIMAPDTMPFYVSEVSHVAKLEVDELGSRAAAVTDIGIKNMSLMTEENPIIFTADRPFIFFIQDKESGMILFMGEVRDL